MPVKKKEKKTMTIKDYKEEQQILLWQINKLERALFYKNANTWTIAKPKFIMTIKEFFNGRK